MSDNAKNSVRIFEGLAIRDTKIKYPDDKIWVETNDIDKVVFGVINDLNQNVSVQPIGRAGAAMGNLGSATTISKNSEGIVTLDLGSYWAPYVAVSLTASSAPTGGSITVYAITRDK